MREPPAFSVESVIGKSELPRPERLFLKCSVSVMLIVPLPGLTLVDCTSVIVTLVVLTPKRVVIGPTLIAGKLVTARVVWSYLRKVSPSVRIRTNGPATLVLLVVIVAVLLYVTA